MFLNHVPGSKVKPSKHPDKCGTFKCHKPKEWNIHGGVSCLADISKDPSRDVQRYQSARHPTGVVDFTSNTNFSLSAKKPKLQCSKMPNPWDYKYPSPLAGFENAPPLSTETNDDGKSLVNPKRDGLSEAYESFTQPLKTDRRGGLYVHVTLSASI